MTGFGNKNSKVSKLFANDIHIRGKTNNKPLILQNSKISPTDSLTFDSLTVEDLKVNNDLSVGNEITGDITFSGTDVVINNDLTVSGDIKSNVNFTGDVNINSGADLDINSGGELILETGSSITQQTGSTFTQNSGGVLIIGGTLSLTGTLSASSSSITQIAGLTSFTPSAKTVSSNTITEPVSRYVQIATNGSTINTITTTGSTNYAEITLITGAGITTTIAHGAGNIELASGTDMIITGNKSLTLRKRDTTGNWVEVCASNPKEFFIVAFGAINVPDLDNEYVMNIFQSTGFPMALEFPFDVELVHAVLKIDDTSAFTGDITYQFWVDDSSVDSFDLGDSDFTARSIPTGTTALTGETSTNIAHYTPSSPIQIASGEYFHHTINISATNLTTGVEASSLLYFQKNE